MSLFTPSQTSQWVRDCLQKADLCKKTGNLEEAANIYRMVLDLQSDNLAVIINLGALLHQQGNRQAAMEVTESALGFDSEYSPALTNLGLMYEEVCDFEKAEYYYLRGLKGTCVTPQTTWNLSRLLLAKGPTDNNMWRLGTVMYEVRWKWDQFRAAQLNLKFPEWRGKESLEGQSILVYYEQGYGDMIQHCRFVTMLKSRYPGAAVTLLVQKPLVGLMENLADVVTDTLPDRQFDYQCPMMSLCHALGVSTMQDIPRPNLLQWNRPKSMTGRITCTRKLKVGICWSGNPQNTNNRQRSIPREKLLPLLGYSQVEWYSFQKGHDLLTPEEVTEYKIWQPIAEVDSFQATADRLREMDICITVCTSIAHLAASLGIPTWLLLSTPGHYIWGRSGETTPWYPSMTILRQEKPGDWDTLVLNTRKHLESAV